MELVTSKENLKNFIERWEEHPNSPYVFDASATLILPLHNGEKNASSGFSSRGCSPSPCESLSSNTELFSAEVRAAENMTNDMDSTKANTTDDYEFAHIKSNSQLFERPSSSTPTLKGNKEYLQSFDRRHSDSNYVSNHTSSLEKVNLAEEIKKLSDRLLMLSSINAELQDYNQRAADNKTKSFDTPSAKENLCSKPPPSTAAFSDTTTSTEATENLKNSKLNEGFSKSVDQIESIDTTTRTSNIHFKTTSRTHTLLNHAPASFTSSTVSIKSVCLQYQSIPIQYQLQFCLPTFILEFSYYFFSRSYTMYSRLRSREQRALVKRGTLRDIQPTSHRSHRS